MTNIFRKLFGLGPSIPSNVIRPQKRSIIKPIDETNQELSDLNIYPALVSGKTIEFDMHNELAYVFHEREYSYAKTLITYVLLDNINLEVDVEPQIFQIKTADKDEAFYDMLTDKGEQNLDNFEVPFEFWNPVDEKSAYKILSTKISFFASEKLMSKKHMLEAHKMLDSKELMVSIPRRGLIFVCDNNLENEHKKNFMNMHAFLILDEKSELELLCEDIFIVKNGEIEGTFELNQLSDLLRNK